jgi:hypothetical protein
MPDATTARVPDPLALLHVHTPIMFDLTFLRIYAIITVPVGHHRSPDGSSHVLGRFPWMHSWSVWNLAGARYTCFEAYSEHLCEDSPFPTANLSLRTLVPNNTRDIYQFACTDQVALWDREPFLQ